MKRWLAAILAVFMTLTLCACEFSIGSLQDIGSTKQTEGKEENENQQTETTEQTNPPKQAVTLSDDWKDFTFELDGEVYQLPCSYQTFVANGWKIDENRSDISENTEIAGYTRAYVYLTNGAVRFYAALINMSGNMRLAKDCNIGGITVEASDNLGLKIAKGITCSSAKDDVEAAFGVPTSASNYEDYSSLRYEADSYVTMSFYIYTKDTTNNEITLQCFVATEEDKTVASTDRPAYLNDYVAPETLAEDVTATQFELDGVLYQLPCPVDEFTKNGWSITSDYIGSLGAGNKESGMTLTKGDAKISLSLINLAKIEVTSVNCAVYEVDFSYYDLDEVADDYVKFAGGLDMGSNLQAIEKACAEFDKYEGSSSVSFTEESEDYSTSVKYSWYTEDEQLYVTIKNSNWEY